MVAAQRAEAKKAGLTRYFTGKPCPQGHVCERMVSSGSCLECIKARKPKYHEQAKRYSRKRYWADPEAYRQQTRDRNRLYPEKLRDTNKRRAEIIRLWFQAHPDKRAEHVERYRSTEKGKATRQKNAVVRRLRMTTQVPLWADLDLISSMYSVAARLSETTGVPHVVDHIIPIDGVGVSGLHVHNNLQVITAIENSQKGNRYTQ